MSAAITPRSTIGMISVMTPNPRRLGAFWSELMGLPITDGASDDLMMLDFDREVGPIAWILERCDDVAVGTAPVAPDIHTRARRRESLA